MTETSARGWKYKSPGFMLVKTSLTSLLQCSKDAMHILFFIYFSPYFKLTGVTLYIGDCDIMSRWVSS